MPHLQPQGSERRWCECSPLCTKHKKKEMREKLLPLTAINTSLTDTHSHERHTCIAINFHIVKFMSNQRDMCKEVDNIVAVINFFPPTPQLTHEKANNLMFNDDVMPVSTLEEWRSFLKLEHKLEWSHQLKSVLVPPLEVHF